MRTVLPISWIPRYPLIALSVLKEASRQLAAVAEGAWAELRERLKGENAPELFFNAIVAYASDLCDGINEYILDEASGSRELPRLRSRIEAEIIALKQLTKFGLGLSQEAVRVPPGFEAAVFWIRNDQHLKLVDEDVLRDELARRVANEPFVVEAKRDPKHETPPVAAVRTVPRAVAFLRSQARMGTWRSGPSPSVSINTAAAQINRQIRASSGRTHPAFLRLPEKPEDVQRRENRYSIMARLLFPDLSEAQYAHSVWNAMNLLESRVALRTMQRWDMPEQPTGGASG